MRLVPQTVCPSFSNALVGAYVERCVKVTYDVGDKTSNSLSKIRGKIAKVYESEEDDRAAEDMLEQMHIWDGILSDDDDPDEGHARQRTRTIADAQRGIGQRKNKKKPPSCRWTFVEWEHEEEVKQGDAMFLMDPTEYKLTNLNGHWRILLYEPVSST